MYDIQIPGENREIEMEEIYEVKWLRIRKKNKRKKLTIN